MYSANYCRVAPAWKASPIFISVVLYSNYLYGCFNRGAYELSSQNINKPNE